jgi:hypothetical protein
MYTMDYTLYNDSLRGDPNRDDVGKYLVYNVNLKQFWFYDVQRVKFEPLREFFDDKF